MLQDEELAGVEHQPPLHAILGVPPKSTAQDRIDEKLREWEARGGSWGIPPTLWNERDKRRWRKYGVTPCDIRRLRIEQDGRCAVCNRRKVTLVVDHDHATGKVRGLLCNDCNKAEGFLRGSAESAIAMWAYLDYHSPAPTTQE